MRKFSQFGVLILFCYLFLGQLWAIWNWTVDDMFITLRYAKHWADGSGILWNLNQPPVEGYSNFSFLFLGFLAIKAGIDPVLFLKIMGIIGLLLTASGVYLLSRFWFSPGWALIPVIWLLFYKGQIIWTASGLETTCYQAMLIYATYTACCGLMKNSKPKSLWFILTAILLSLAGFTRPEAPLFAGAFFLGFLAFNRSRQAFYFLGSYLLITLPYIFWRYHYFGTFIPNSVACKGYSGYNLDLLKSYLYASWLLLPLAVVATLKSRDPRMFFFWAPTLIYAVVLVGSEGLSAFDNRLFLPAYSLLLPMAFLGLAELFMAKGRLIMGVAVASVLLIGIPKLSLSGYKNFTVNPVSGELARIQLADWLAKHTTAQSSVVIGDAGLVPYRLFYRDFIDSFCLNNKQMITWPKPVRNQKFCQNVFEQQPPYVIITFLQEGSHKTFLYADSCLQKRLKKNSEYKKLQQFVVKMDKGSYHYEVYGKD